MNRTMYEVSDENGPYGTYKNLMDALVAVNKLDQMGNSPKLHEVVKKEVDWQRHLNDLFYGSGGM